MKMGKRIERFIAIVLSTIIVISNLMLISNDVSAASVITNANSVSGSNYTSDATLASNLDAIFKGTVNIFKTASNGHLSLPLGTVTSGDDVYTISGSGTYKSCHAYACAVYYKLFGDLLSGGNTSACKNSTAVCVGASSISYSLLSSNGVKCGSMIRTTPNSNGTYNGNSGHTMIILSYNSSGITFLENQIPSGSNYRVQIKTQTWSEFNSFALTNNSHGTRYVSFILVPKNGSTLVVPNPGAFSLNDPGLISQGNYTLSWGASSNATNYDLRIKAPNDSNYVSVYSGTSRSYTYNFSQYGVYHAIVIATNSSGNANTSIVAIKVYSLEWQNSSYDSTIGRYAVDVSYIDLDLITYGTSVYYEIYRNGTMLYKSNYSSDYRAQGIYDANHGTPTYVNGNLISGDYSVTFYSEAGRIYGEIIHVYNTYQETVDNPIQVRLEYVPYVPGNARMVELIITNTYNVSQTVSGVRYGSRLQAVSGLEPGDTVYRYSLVPNDSYVYINGFGSFGRTVNDTEGPSYSNYSVTWIDDNTILVGVDVSDPSGIYIYEFGSVAALKRDGSYVSSDEVQYIYGLDIGDNPSEHYVKNYTPFDRIVYMGTNYGTSCGDVSRMNVTNLTDTSAHFSFTMDLSELDRTQSESDYQIVIFSTDAYSNRNSELFEIDLSRCFVSPTPTATNTPVPTLTDTPVPTVTDIPAPTATDAPVPTVTDVPAPTATPTVTSEPTVVPTATDTPTVIPTTTSEPTPTEEVSPTPEGPTMAPPTPTDAPDDTRVADFVERLYTVALDRPSEEGGKQYWISELLRGTSGATAARGFFLGSELTGKNISDVEFVTRLYRTFMDREPDDIGLSYWVAKLGNGATREEVFKGFINSSEWIRICEDCGINPGSDGYGAEKLRTAFVTRLYTTCLGRESDATGVAYWSGKLAQGNITGTQLAHDFFFSPEFVDGNYSNVEFIRRMYRTFMGREADDTGLSYWITKMSNGATREQVFMGFAQSSEFAGICQQAGIQV